MEGARRWLVALAVATGVGVVALLSNLTTPAEMAGRWQEWHVVRLTVSALANSGTVWAGLSIVAGWIVGKRWWEGVLAGTVAGVWALVVHYGINALLDLPYQADFTGNEKWFLLGLKTGPVLGIIGVAARHRTWWGLLGRLAIPAGALLEPTYTGMFHRPALLPWPDRYSAVACGVLLLAAGSMAAGIMLWRQSARWAASVRPRSRSRCA